MWSLHTANAEHWVPIKTVSSFKRMREYVSNGHDWIVKALRTSEELEVDEASENVRRRTEVQQPKGQFERSIYAVS
jgi:lupus La protein